MVNIVNQIILKDALSSYLHEEHEGHEVFKDYLIGAFGPPILCIIPDFGFFFKEKAISFVTSPNFFRFGFLLEDLKDNCSVSDAVRALCLHFLQHYFAAGGMG